MGINDQQSHVSTSPPEKKSFDPFAGPMVLKVNLTTPAQKEIWSSCKIGGAGANRAYNESRSLILKGTICKETLQRSLDLLMVRHEALRTVFSTDGSLLSILKTFDCQLVHKDLRGELDGAKDKKIQDYLAQEVNHVFNLVDGPLFRATLVTISSTLNYFIFTAHHIICDGWSMGLALQETGAIYTSLLRGEPLKLPEPDSFYEYAEYQEHLLNSVQYHKIENFWLNLFNESIPRLELPLSKARPSLRTYNGRRIDFFIPESISIPLRALVVNKACSLLTVLLAAFEVLFYQITGQDNFVIGVPASGQSISGKTRLVGHCANLLPLKTTINPVHTFAQHLELRKQALLDAHEHQQLSFGHLLQRLAISRDPSRIPLVPVVLNMDGGNNEKIDFAGLEFELQTNARKFETFEMFININDQKKELSLEWSYNTDLFNSVQICDMMGAYERLLSSIIKDPDDTLGNYAKFEGEDYKELNNTHRPYPEETLDTLLAEQAFKTPHHLALKFRNETFNYVQLHTRTNKLAHFLLDLGVAPGDLVGIALPRSSEMILSLLAILKCGAAYLPLDPSYPSTRIEFMLKDSEASFLITSTKVNLEIEADIEVKYIEDILAGLEKYPDARPRNGINNSSLAYIIYTSGSTGKPKGVQITHKNLVNFLYSLKSEPGIQETDRLLAITTISFDIAGIELYFPLLNGAAIILADDETVHDGRLLQELMLEEKITMMQATPTTWQMLLDTSWEHSLPLIALSGGEALNFNLAQRLLSKCEAVWNLYGPTETTIYSAIKKIQLNEDPICVGRPVANTQIYIINENKDLVAPGMIGEIAIAGDGVSKGYWKRPELNEQKFINSRLSPGTPMYLTGDLGVLRSSGEIQCLGRIDQQVKIRGHRIEPEETENSIRNMENVHNAAVMASEDRLIAFVVPAMRSIPDSNQIAAWRTILQQTLPRPLLPQEYIILDEMPVTPNGKLDRKALLKYRNLEIPNIERTRGPESVHEKLIAEIWKDCLNLRYVDVQSDFFELGGHSIMAVQVMTRLEKSTGKRLAVTALLEYSTIEKLAQLLDKNSKVVGDSLIPIKPEGTKTPLYLIHGVGLNVRKFRDLIQNLDKDQPVFGLQGLGIQHQDHTISKVEEIAAHYIETILSNTPETPIALAGHSYGGLISYEMARQLGKKGIMVENLIMLDTYVEPVFFYSSAFRKALAGLEYQAGKKFAVIRRMCKSWGSFIFELRRKKDEFRERYIIPFDGDDMEREELKRIEEIDRLNEKIMKQYKIVPQKFRINLLRAKNAIYYMHDPVSLGWNRAALNGLHIYEVPGNHNNMFAPPNDAIAAGILQKVLDKEI